MLGSKIKHSFIQLASNNWSFLNLIFLLLLSLIAHGEEYIKDARNSEIIINSDDLVYDKNANIASFENNVILWFNDMVLKTTKIKIIYKQIAGRNKIDKIVIPSKLFALKYDSSDVLIADYGTFFFDKGELLLEGNVILQHEDNILKTNKLVLMTELKKIADN